MKKIVLSALALILVGVGCIDLNAQSKEQQKAEAAAQKALKKEFDGFMKVAKKNSQTEEGMTPNVPVAREAIQNAAKSPLAEGNAEFYLVAGQVENAAFLQAAQAQDYPTYAASAQAGFDYFSKAFSAANGNTKIMSAAQQGALSIYQNTSGLAMIGNVYYQTNEYEKCLAAFRAAKTAADAPVIASQKGNPIAQLAIERCTADSTINNLALNCFAIAQYNLNDTTEAIKELLYLKEHVTDDVQMNQVLQQLALDYYGKDDSIAFENTLKEGVQKLPSETWYVNNLINVYINRGDLESAGKFVDQAIAADPTNAALINVKGTMLEQQEKIDEAFALYTKALELDPTSAAVNVSLGRYYYNRALAIEDEYFNKKKFDEGDRQAQPMYEKALPYYEAAYSFDSERSDKTIAIALRALYGRQIAKVGSSSPKGKELIEKRNEVSAAYGFAVE